MSNFTEHSLRFLIDLEFYIELENRTIYYKVYKLDGDYLVIDGMEGREEYGYVEIYNAVEYFNTGYYKLTPKSEEIYNTLFLRLAKIKTLMNNYDNA